MIKRIEEICIEFKIEEQTIKNFVEEEWVIPLDGDSLKFDEEDEARIGIIMDLREELDVNNDAIPIILNLLDQIHALKAEIRKLKTRKD